MSITWSRRAGPGPECSRNATRSLKRQTRRENLWPLPQAGARFPLDLWAYCRSGASAACGEAMDFSRQNIFIDGLETELVQLMLARTLNMAWKTKASAGTAFVLPRHFLAVCLSILGLYIQLVTATACLASGPSWPDQDAAAAGAPFPICHGGGSQDGGSGQGDGQGRHPCPLCAAHYQTAAAPVGPDAVASRSFILIATRDATPRPVRTPAVFPSGTSPRGPPATV